MLIPALTLEIFIKERRINVGRRTTEVWFPVGFASWLNAQYLKKCNHCFSLIATLAMVIFQVTSLVSKG